MKLLKTLLKIGFGLFLLVVFAGVGGYFLFLNPAPAEDVCENFFQVSLQEVRTKLAEGTSVSPDEIGFTLEDLYTQLQMTPEQCIAQEERGRRVTTKSGIYVASLSKCQAGAKTLQEFESCGG